MLMPKKNRVSIYEYLFKEGVMVAKKDVNIRHPTLKSIPNLHVIKAMQSLKSRGYVKEQFAWRHFYWYLTNEGIQYLRDFLHLPAEIVPSTLKRQQRPDVSKGRGDARPAQTKESRTPEDRMAYRANPASDKKADVGPGAAPMEFRGGYGRGRAPNP